MGVIYRACHRHDVWVSLTDAEYDEAVAHGRSLWAESQADPRVRDRWRAIPNGVDGERVQIVGAIAECAGAKACGIPWLKGRNTFKAADLAHNIEVRLIGVESYGLRVSPRDPPERRVVGVVIPKGHERDPYRIPGWINARHGQKAIWEIDPWQRQQPLYAVPQEVLHPLSTLLALVQDEQAWAQAWECPQCGTRDCEHCRI